VQRAREPEDRGSIDVIAHDEATKSRLLFLSSAADCETEVAIPRRIMRRHPNVAITSRFLDSHVCVCSDIAFHLRSFFLQLHHVAVGSRFFED
jgi:hypothetical protein